MIQQGSFTAAIQAPPIGLVDAEATTAATVGTLPSITNDESMINIVNAMSSTTSCINESWLIGQRPKMQKGEVTAAI